jgi:uncharacterized protein YaiE (UPF0345 family)
MEHNFYFDGKMQSLGFQADEGEATVGVLEPGTYPVPTDCVERLTILSGRGRVKVGDQAWKEIKTGDMFTLPPNVDVTWEIAPPNVCYFCLFPE